MNKFDAHCVEQFTLAPKMELLFVYAVKSKALNLCSESRYEFSMTQNGVSFRLQTTLQSVAKIRAKNGVSVH